MTTRRWTDLTPRASIAAALDALVTEHGHELLDCTEIEVHVLCVDTEPPTQAIYDVTGSLGGRWTVGLSFSARSSHWPVERCPRCGGHGKIWLPRVDGDVSRPCEVCHGFGRVPAYVACVYSVESDQVRTATRRVGWLTASAAPQAIARATEDAAAGDCVSIAFPCPHLSHLDPRASHLGHCPDCGQVVGSGLDHASPPESVADHSRPAGSALPDPPAALPLRSSLAAPGGGGDLPLVTRGRQ